MVTKGPLRLVTTQPVSALVPSGQSNAPALNVTVGHSSVTGPRPRNEDFCGAVTPEAAELANKGLLAAVADGVGGHAAGREAAEYTVRGLLADYYATPDTWSVPQSLDAVANATNLWL